MARKNRNDHSGAAHHVYGRGNRRQPIFDDEQDCRVFLAKLLKYQGDHGIRILAYCLMINHYHLVVESLKGDMSGFMKRVLGSYTRTYNDRHNTVGHVLQGRFQNRRCKTDEEVKGAIRYVHRNPVQAKLVAAPEEWVWSSARGFLSGRDPLIDAPEVLQLFGGIDGYNTFMSEPSRFERPRLDEIALEIFGPGFNELLRGSKCDPRAVEARRDLAVAALQLGHRRSEIAKFLGRTPASITALLRSEKRI